MARQLIKQLNSVDLCKVREELSKRRCQSLDPNYQISEALVQLSQLYILQYIRAIDPDKGIRSSKNKLSELGSLGSRFFNDYVKILQKKYANRAVRILNEYACSLDPSAMISDVPARVWAKYVGALYLRTDIRERVFASSLFSEQVVMAYLILNRVKIAVVNDIYNADGYVRYVRVLQGNGSSDFIDADEEKVDEPIIVFAGCSQNPNQQEVQQQMDEHLKSFSHLVLACAAHYPQFPKVREDSTFNATPIYPEESIAIEAIQRQEKIQGTSAKKPSLFCLNHIYLVSGSQIKDMASLPSYKIPTILQQ